MSHCREGSMCYVFRFDIFQAEGIVTFVQDIYGFLTGAYTELLKPTAGVELINFENVCYIST